jgi:hypothetical protein
MPLLVLVLPGAGANAPRYIKYATATTAFILFEPPIGF